MTRVRFTLSRRPGWDFALFMPINLEIAQKKENVLRSVYVYTSRIGEVADTTKVFGCLWTDIQRRIVYEGTGDVYVSGFRKL
jgi:hypothetical protein